MRDRLDLEQIGQKTRAGQQRSGKVLAILAASFILILLLGLVFIYGRLSSSRRELTILMIAFGLLFPAILLFAAWRSARARTQGLSLATRPFTQDPALVMEVMRHALPELGWEKASTLPQMLPAGRSMLPVVLVLVFGTALFLLLMLPLNQLLKRLWPGVSEPLSLFLSILPFILLPLVGLTLWQWYTRRRTRAGSMPSTLPDFSFPTATGAAPKKSRRGLQAAVGFLIPVALLFLLEFLFRALPDRLESWGKGSTLISVLAAAVTILPPLVHLSFTRAPLHWVRTALGRGRYDEARRRVQLLSRFLGPDYNLLLLEAEILLLAGRHGEAEQIVRARLVEEARNSPALLLAGRQLDALLAVLGQALTGQGRYEEAMRAMEGAIELKPERAVPYSDLAEVYLYQGTEPARALELLEQVLAVKVAGEPALNLALPSKKVVGEEYQLPEYYWQAILWADQAWALALLGRHLDAAPALEQARRVIGRRFLPGVAAVYYRAGQVLRLRGDRAAAMEHWRQAVELDPQGYGGRLAAAALQAGMGDLFGL